MSLQIGDVIEGKYRIVRLLGEGGMGAVYEGENTRIHRKVAIKVLHAAVAAKADVVQRFEREAQAAGRIGSEHIVEVLDLGNLPSGERFMVMEYLEGESLGDRIKRRKRLNPHEVAQILHQLLEGLAAAHAAGIIHRDLKPDNVYLLSNKAGQKDFVKVLDFGVSKFSALDSDMSMTKTGAVMGTPFYMAPEQARGGKVDIRSDLYSVGVVVYQAVTGRVPFHAETFNELVFKIALESPEPAEMVAPGLDPGFAGLISRAMVRDPAGRFQSAKEFQAAVGQWLMTAPPPDGGYDMARVSFPGGIPMPGFAMSSPSSPGMGQSGAGLGQSGAGPLAQSGAPLSQSGANPLVQSQPQLGASQAGLAMTSPQPKKSGAMIALGVVGLLAIAGGGFFAYRRFAVKPMPPPPVVATTTTTTAATAAAPPSAAPTAPATVATAAPPTETAVAATPENSPTHPGAGVKPGAPWPKGKPAPSATAAAGKATAAAATPPPPANTGRTIGTEL